MDYSIFVMKTGFNRLVFSMFVNDIKIIAPNESGITQRMKAELTSAFLMVDMDPLRFYLGLNVKQDQINRTIKLSQPSYIDKVFSWF